MVYCIQLATSPHCFFSFSVVKRLYNARVTSPFLPTFSISTPGSLMPLGISVTNGRTLSLSAIIFLPAALNQFLFSSVVLNKSLNCADLFLRSWILPAPMITILNASLNSFERDSIISATFSLLFPYLSRSCFTTSLRTCATSLSEISQRSISLALKIFIISSFISSSITPRATASMSSIFIRVRSASTFCLAVVNLSKSFSVSISAWEI